MDQDGVSAERASGFIEQGLRGRDAGDQTLHLRASFHLQAVWAIIPETPCSEQFVQVACQLVHVSFTGSGFPMRRLWLIFAQTVTIGLAVLFVVSTLKPEWLGKSRTCRWPASSPCSRAGAGDRGSSSPPTSFRDAAKKALPSVVHVFHLAEDQAAP
jgi:hypothetical protein